MIALLISGLVAFAVSVGGTPLLIKALRSRGIGQLIRDDGPHPHPHAMKAGTPTMGGVAIVAAALLGYFAAHIRADILFATSGISLVILIGGLAAVGFADDYLGIRHQRNLGLRKRGKSAGEVMGSGVFALLALQYVGVSTNLSFTRDIAGMELGNLVWALWAVFIITSSANAVNLTDGLDGLAAGSAVLVFAAYVIIGFWEFRHPEIYGVLPAQALDQAVVAAAMAGACAGFLWWNAAPARIFMGDTGSLAIGAAIGGLALLSHTQLLLPIIGGLYVLETTSVIAQIIAFRGFHRRVLRMAPIHHHFEVGGWPEFTVIVRFWLISGMFVGLGLGLFYADFINLPGAIE